MNSTTLAQMLQKGFRVTVGATASIIESLQDPQRRDENFSRLRTDLSQLTEEWEAKGEMTEREARNYVDTILNQQFNRNPSASSEPASPTGSGTTSSAPSAASPEVQQDLQELTTQISALRAELERLREQNS
jgi:polyhydroxyalkanoate synthesis regulator phasin